MTLPNKYRGIAWLLLIVALPGAAWHFAVGETAGVWAECRSMAARLSRLEPGASQYSPLLPDKRELILSGVLLDTVRRAAEEHGVRVAGYEPRITSKEDGLAVHTAQITLTGSYTTLLQLTARIGDALPACRLRTMEWRTRTDRQTRRRQLILILYVQQIVQIQ